MRKLLLVALLVFPNLTLAEDVLKTLLSNHKALAALDTGKIDRILFNKNQTAVAFCYDETPSTCYIVDKHHAVDVSDFERSNRGRIGLYQQDYFDRAQTYPIKWFTDEPGVYVVEFETRFYKEGQRYRPKGPVMVRNGRYIRQ